MVGVSFPAGVAIFFLTASGPAVESTQPHLQWAPGPISPGVKLSGREADHSLHLVPR